jgi:hypothetical protein
LALALFAETARHAQGQALHNRLSFDKSGRPVDLKTVREDIRTVKNDGALAATKLLLNCKWLQSSALLPSQAVMQSANKASAFLWTDKCKREILEFAHHAGNAGAGAIDVALCAVVAPALGDEVTAAVRDFLNQPNFWLINRIDGSTSPPNRLAITFHGMTWSESASVALTLIADQARCWSAQYRTKTSTIPARKTGDRVPLAQSIAALTYCWLESSVPAALRGKYRSAALRSDFEATPDHPLTAEDIMVGQAPGKDLLREARSIIARLPKAGTMGYSAFAHASLWFQCQHDDLGHYRAKALRSSASIDEMKEENANFVQHGKIPAEVVASASFRCRGKRSLPGQSKAVSAPRISKKAKQDDCEIAAIVAQAEAMLLGPTATDSMRAYLLRTERKTDRPK